VTTCEGARIVVDVECHDMSTLLLVNCVYVYVYVMAKTFFISVVYCIELYLSSRGAL